MGSVRRRVLSTEVLWEVKTRCGNVRREEFGKEREHLQRPDCLSAPMALPGDLGRVWEREQPYLTRRQLAPMLKALDLESGALTSGPGSTTILCDALNKFIPLPASPGLCSPSENISIGLPLLRDQVLIAWCL